MLALAQPAVANQGTEWEAKIFSDLCAKYVGDCREWDLTEGNGAASLEEVAVALGKRLASTGVSGVPTQDIATLALLLSRQGEAEPAKPSGQATEEIPSLAPRRGADSTSAQPAAGSRSARQVEQASQPVPADSTQEPTGQTGFADISKGQEGFLQGVERLGELPLTERMTMTGDITSGLQAATVNDSADLTSTFGRARVNFVTRAVPGSADGRFGEGYFFVQMVAAGGPFDTSAVGGPGSFSPLNDVATDRSRFNEGTSRGNLYLAKAFYQQEVQFGRDHVVGRAGIIDLSDFFDTNDFANNESRQFISSAFVNSPGFKAGISAPGFMGEYHRRSNREWLTGLVFRTGYAVSRTERAFTSPIWTGEVELQTMLRGERGKYRFGGTLGNVADVGGVDGFHVSFDQWVSRRIGVYGRFARANSGPGSMALGPVRQSYGGGLQWRLVDERDRVSAWGFGFSQAFGIEVPQPLASERILETYYRWQLSENFSLTPDFQLVFGSGGSQQQGTHVMAGMRMNFGF